MAKYTGTESCPKCGTNGKRESFKLTFLTPEKSVTGTEKISLECVTCGYLWLVDPMDVVV